MIDIEREAIHKLLQLNVLTVTFIKKNGDERIMECTLRKDLLPPVVVKEGVEKKEKKVNEAVMAVYDINAKGFRSFRLDSIKNIGCQIGDSVVSVVGGKEVNL